MPRFTGITLPFERNFIVISIAFIKFDKKTIFGFKICHYFYQKKWSNAKIKIKSNHQIWRMIDYCKILRIIDPLKHKQKTNIWKIMIFSFWSTILALIIIELNLTLLHKHLFNSIHFSENTAFRFLWSLLKICNSYLNRINFWFFYYLSFWSIILPLFFNYISLCELCMI